MKNYIVYNPYLYDSIGMIYMRMFSAENDKELYNQILDDNGFKSSILSKLICGFEHPNTREKYENSFTKEELLDKMMNGSIGELMIYNEEILKNGVSIEY